MRRMIILSVVCAAFGYAAPATPAAPARVSRLARVASTSVVGVQTGSGLTTGFVLRSGVIVAVASRVTGIRLTTASGATALVSAFAQNGAFIVARLGKLELTPLPFSHRGPRAKASAYVLGAPLGYGGENIRETPLRFVGRARAGSRTVAGHLPSWFAGAPVVTPTGTVIGAVVATGTHTWTLADVASLETAAQHPISHQSSAGLTITLLLAGVATLMFVIVRLTSAMVGRRSTRSGGRAPLTDGHHARGALSLRLPSHAAPDPPTESLVRRRDPAPVADHAEDFEIVIKSRGDER
jgi:hypothetical protein